MGIAAEKSKKERVPNEADVAPIIASMREGFGRGLVKAARLDEKIVAVSADLIDSVGFGEFKRTFPERMIQVGVAEQNLAGVASGLAASGLKPFMASYAVFSPGRNWEQIRTTIAYNDRPVVIVGSHAGLNVGPDGGSHQALEDIALMRALPNMIVLSPCDALEAEKAALLAAKSKGPVYVRLPREKNAIITSAEDSFEIGRASIVFGAEEGSHAHVNMNERKSPDRHPACDTAIVATGLMVERAILAAKELLKKGRRVKVVNLSTIKPLDEHLLIRVAHETRSLVTAEEHQIAGGMGGAIAELMSAHFPVPMEFVAVHDRYGQSGRAHELMDEYGLSVDNIIQAVEKVLIRK